MFITTFLVGVVMLVCYDINPVLVTLFLVVFGAFPFIMHRFALHDLGSSDRGWIDLSTE